MVLSTRGSYCTSVDMEKAELTERRRLAELLVGRGEEARKAVASRHGLLDRVELALDEALVKAIDVLDGPGIGEAEVVWPEAHDVAMLLVQADMSDLRAALVDVPEAPPVGDAREERARVLVEAVVVVVAGEMDNDDDDEGRRPMPCHDGKDVFENHREARGGKKQRKAEASTTG